MRNSQAARSLQKERRYRTAWLGLPCRQRAISSAERLENFKEVCSVSAFLVRISFNVFFPFGFLARMSKRILPVCERVCQPPETAFKASGSKLWREPARKQRWFQSDF